MQDNNQPQKFVNPITGKANVDEVIKESEAKKRGYMDLQFILRYLEDDNEYIKWFVIDGKHVVVDLDKPQLQYKKKTQINHERVIQEVKEEKKDNNISIVSTFNPTISCSLDDMECVSCSG